MNDSLYLGFDGGATKTTGAALDHDGNPVAEVTGAASNFQIIGTEKASEHILAITQRILDTLHADFSRVKTIYLGLTGAGRIADADRMRNAFIDFLKDRNFPIPAVQIGSDALAALEGAFSGKPGMILISGTGSILFAKDHDDRIHRVGGWGRYIGDEGSGYALGRACLAAVAKEMDGRGEKTSMSEILKERFHIADQKTMISAVYQDGLDLATLAPIVIEAAEAGDVPALNIVVSAAVELADHVQAALKTVGQPVSLALIGSIASTENVLSRELHRLVRQRFPGLQIQKPEKSPAMGAALLAFKNKAL